MLRTKRSNRKKMKEFLSQDSEANWYELQEGYDKSPIFGQLPPDALVSDKCEAIVFLPCNRIQYTENLTAYNGSTTTHIMPDSFEELEKSIFMKERHPSKELTT